MAKGRGVSYVKYELVRTYIGAVAEVEVDRASGVIRVPKFTVVGSWDAFSLFRNNPQI